MSKSYRYTPDTEQSSKQMSKKAKLTKQQQGRQEKQLLRTIGE